MATKAEVKLPPSTPLSLNWLLQTQQAVKTNTDGCMTIPQDEKNEDMFLNPPGLINT